MIKKIIGLQAYVVTGLGLITSTMIEYNKTVNIVLIAAICGFFIIGIKEHYDELKGN